MNWWKTAILLSVAWLVLTIGGGIMHVEFLAEGITPKRAGALSELYGMACGFGLVVIWIVAYVVHRRRSA